jgi:hypothetical protein
MHTYQCAEFPAHILTEGNWPRPIFAYLFNANNQQDLQV